MSCKIIFTILLSICFVWELEALISYNSNGYPKIADANRNCWPHDIQARGGRYFCQTFKQTVLNKYAEQFGYETSKTYEDNEKFSDLIKFVENNGFCASFVSNRIQHLYPDYKKYLIIGAKIRQFWRIYGYCAPRNYRVQKKRN